MTLVTGKRLGPYLVEAPIGAGGMGEVYRGHDTRLDRAVAIKVLPTVLAESAELRERFEREARLLSKLNHPNICVVYDVGHQNGTTYLVMELLEGETLAVRIARGPLPVQQATSIAVQVGGALDRAHRVGVIHRDVKPENIMLTKSGAKLLDFGLAKPAPIQGGLGGGVTKTLPITGEGTILGTLQYMAPEQLDGRPADARSDIFAFGAVLHEMITGKRAFAGDTPATVISAIIKDDPPPLVELQPLVPSALDAIVRTCLEKDPDERWQNAHDLVSQLRWIQLSGSQPHMSVGSLGKISRRRIYIYSALALCGLLAIATGVAAGRFLQTEAPRESIRFTIAEPAGTTFSPNPAAPFAAVSPDGRYIVFDSSLSPGLGALHLRSLNDTVARRLPGTDNGWLPFWSPDSKYVAFFADGALKKTAIATGGVETICKIDGFEGGTWNHDDVVLFSKGPAGIFRVDASGGEPVAVTKLDESRNEVYHRAPIFLPDGKHFLYSTQPGNDIFYASLDGTAPRRLLTADARALYSPPGFLLFARNGALFAQKFDAKQGRLSGDPVRIANSVRTTPGNGRAAFSVSQTGVLVYRSASDRNTTTVRWIDRSGKREGVLLEGAEYFAVALSPDESRLAFHRHEEPSGGGIWVKNLVRGDTIRLTSDPSHNIDPTWSPDGQRIVFTSYRNRGSDFYVRAANGTGEDELLFKSEERKEFPRWSPDERFLIYQVMVGARSDIWIWSHENRAKPKPLITSSADEVQPQLSPDGKWLVYASSESGSHEVYVQPYPPNGTRYPVSSGGGVQPFWRRDGRELFYLTLGGALKAVRVLAASSKFEAGVPQTLFEADITGLHPLGNYLYQPSNDGSRFVVAERPAVTDTSGSEPLTVLVDWTAELRKDQ
jgi:serine/threonine protein kinase/Tol biopolymer transport system component